MEKKYAIEKYLTKDDVSKIKSLKEKSNIIETVTKDTEEGIYNFRGCPNVAIWNINSFAEFYMQIEEKYKKDYPA